MDEPAVRRAHRLVQACTAVNVAVGGLGCAMAIPALGFNWTAMSTDRIARVGLLTTALLMLLVGGLHSATALRHRPAGAGRGLFLAGIAALGIALPAIGQFLWELFRALRLGELTIWSSLVIGPAVVMVVGGAIAAANLIVLGIYGRAMPEFEPEA